MSAFTSAQNGNWNAGATWGNAGNTEGTDYPGNTDTASIGHTVTINGAYPASGSIGAVTITSGGILKYSTAGSETLSLQLAGNLAINSGGEFDMGTVATPVPSTSTATLKFACGSDGQYGVTNNDGGKIILQGASKTYWRTKLSTAIAANDVHFHTANETGWAVGNTVIVPCTDGSTSEVDYSARNEAVIITGISGTTIYIDSNGDGSATTPKLTYAHVINADLGLLNRNVLITVTNAAYNTYIYDKSTASTTNFDWARLDEMGGYYSDGTNNIPAINYCVFSNGGFRDIDKARPGQVIDSNFFYKSNRAICWNETDQLNVLGSTVSNCLFIYGGTAFDHYRVTTNNIVSNCDTYGFVEVFRCNTYESAIYLLHQNNFIVNSNFNSASGGAYTGLLRLDGKAYGTVDNKYCGFLFKNCTFGQKGINKAERMDFYGAFPKQVEYDNCLHSATPTIGANSGIGFEKYSNINQVSGRNLTRLLYGSISDQVTGGQTAAWARGGAGLCVYLNPTSTTAGQTLDWEFFIPVTAATAFQLKFYVKTTQTSNGPTLSCTIYDSNNDCTKLLNAESVVLTSASDWTLYTATSCTPTNTGFCRVVVSALDGSTTGDIGIDDVSVV